MAGVLVLPLRGRDKRRNSRPDEPVVGTMEVLEFEPERIMRVVIREGPETYGTLRFEALDAGQTRVTSMVDMPWAVAGSEHGAMMGMAAVPDLSVLEGMMQRSLRAMKGLVEAAT